jgi:RimJ/RimL family protein N-acetyltransferase
VLDAAEGAAGALRAAFGPPGPRRVIALARPENAAPLAAIRKPGMRFGGEVQTSGARTVRRAAHAPVPLAGGPGGAGACTTC